MSGVPNVTGKVIRPTEVADAPGITPWKVEEQGSNSAYENPIWSYVFKNRMLSELPPSTRTRLSATSLMLGVTNSRYLPGFGI